jgi:hypothetical protein
VATPGGLAGFPVDVWLQRQDINSTGNPVLINRITAGGINTDSTGTSSNYGSGSFDSNTGIMRNGYYVPTEYFWLFKRASGFMDVVAYTGDGSSGRQLTHNLKAVPEMMWIKKRNASGTNWAVYTQDKGPTHWMYLNTNDQSYSGTSFWNNTQPTSSKIILGNHTTVNNTNDKYIGYLFATLPGISKVGSYTGNGGTLDVDCGFTNGARFLLIKRTDNNNDWYLFDTLRGLGSGNDAWLKLSANSQQSASDDLINPLAAGFTLNTAYTAFNHSGGTYLFLAIA